MDGIQAYKGDAARPARAGPVTVYCGQSGGRQDDLKLPEGAATPILDGAGRRRAPGHRIVDHGARGCRRSTWSRPRSRSTRRRSTQRSRPWSRPRVAAATQRRQANYVANREVAAQEPELAERVVSDPAIAPTVSQYADPAFELFKTLSVMQVKKEQLVHRLPRRQRPGPTKKLLEMLLKSSRNRQTEENDDKLWRRPKSTPSKT